MVKVVGIIRFLSIVLFLGILGLVYAYLPVKVLLHENWAQMRIDRETFFYSVTGIFIIVNVSLSLVFALLRTRLSLLDEEKHAWIKALSPVMNIYIVVLVGFVGVVNNPTHVSASSYAYLNFIGPLLVLIWLGGFVYLIVKGMKTA